MKISPTNPLPRRMLLLLLPCLLLLGLAVKVSADNKQPLEIRYYYSSPCASCREDNRFKELAKEQLAGLPESAAYTITAINSFQSDLSFQTACDDLEIPADKRILPMMVINGRYYQGESAIKEQLRPSVEMFYGMDSNGSPQPVDEEVPALSDNTIFDEGDKPLSTNKYSPGDSHIAYFYTSSCGDCEKTLEFYSTLPASVTVDGRESPVSIEYGNILDPIYLERLNQYMDDAQVPEDLRQVPIVFYRGGYLSGYDQIQSTLLSELENGKALDFQPPKSASKATELSVLSVAVTGFINGLNPCSISMLLFLFSLLTAKQSNLLRLSFSFILGKVIAYFAIGLSVYSLLSLLDSSLFQTINRIIGILLILFCLALAVFNFLDFMSAKNEQYQKIRLQLPALLRKHNHSIIRFITEKSSTRLLCVSLVLLGAVISIGEFACTGQIYLATILSLFQQSQQVTGTAVLLLTVYVLSMAVPFILFTLAVCKGRKVLTLSETSRKWMPYIKLTNAVLFLIFAVFAFLKL